jgi:NADPH:quinone reductase-like Zn-dependent oxidoreductase
MQTMKAVLFRSFDGIDALRYEDVPVPEPQAGEVRIRVHAASVNPVDWEVPSGIYQSFMQRALPSILGFDVSGVIDRVGPGVTSWAEGDAVYAQTDYRFDGSFAEYIVVKIERPAHKPRSLDHAQAASVPVCAMAAWSSLFDADAIDLQPGQTVLIHGAAGGVGMFAVQLAKWRGAQVIATASATDHAFLRELGADQVVDYATEQFEFIARQVDGVVDPIGGETQARSLGVIRPGGTLASLVGDHWTGVDRGHDVKKMIVRGGLTPETLPNLTALLDAGVLETRIARVVPLSETIGILRQAHAGKLRGKTVVSIR